MIIDVLRMTLGEWYKLRRRWLPWILLAVLLLISQAFLWGFFAAHHLSDSPDASQREYFTLPSSIGAGIEFLFGTRFAVLIVMVLAASSLGTEYGWGTLRTALTKGVGRWQILCSKLALGVILGGAGLLAMAAVICISSIIGGALSGEGSAPLPGPSESWPGTVATLAKSVYALVPYVVLGTFFVVLTQSTAQGITLSVVFFVVEGLALPPLLGLSDRLESVSAALLIQNVDDWLYRGGGQPLEGASPPDALQSFFVILTYTVVLIAATLWLFLRRDIGGARGE